MIQKIAVTIVKQGSTKLKNIANVARQEPEAILTGIRPNQKKSTTKIISFITELKNKIMEFFRKFLKPKELKNVNKSQTTLYDSADKIEIDRAKRLLNDPNVPNDIKIIIRQELLHAEKTINTNTDAYTCSGLSGLKNANTKGEEAAKNKKITFKGTQDDIDSEHNIEKHLSKEHNVDSNSIDIEDKYTNIVYGKHSQDFEPHSESSLVEALQENQIHRHHLEEHADDVFEHTHLDDVIKHTHLDDIDDLPDTLFD